MSWSNVFFGMRSIDELGGGPHAVNALPHSLPANLAVLLEQHGVALTVDAVLVEFERRGRWVALQCVGLTGDEVRWMVEYPQGVGGAGRRFGPTALIALARAFTVLVGRQER
jgi:hypothetical protein